MRLAKNVFQIWNENKRKVPFFVQKAEWHRDSYFKVTQVEVPEAKWKHFEKTGDIYGKAFGFFCRRGRRITTGHSEELNNSGVYKWRRVYEEEMRPSWTD